MRLVLFFSAAFVWGVLSLALQVSTHGWMSVLSWAAIFIGSYLVGHFWRPITEWLATGLRCHWSCVVCRLRHTSMADIEVEIAQMRAINCETDEAMRVWREQMAKDAEGRVN